MTDAESLLTKEDVAAQLLYDEQSGLFTWINKNRSDLDNRVAGYKRSDGYVSITIFGRRYLAHRLAWLFAHGRWPNDEIDHSNRTRDDNRASNLREASREQNNHNVSYPNRDMPTGVHARRGKYRARIRVRGKETHLGDFSTKEEASDAYKKAMAYRGEFTPAELL